MGSFETVSANRPSGSEDSGRSSRERDVGIISALAIPEGGGEADFGAIRSYHQLMDAPARYAAKRLEVPAKDAAVISTSRMPSCKASSLSRHRTNREKRASGAVVTFLNR